MSKNHTYFITGVTGLVGSYISKKITQNGGKVMALYRPQSHLQKNMNVQWVEGSLFDVLWLREILKDVDFVIHAAGKVSFNESDKALLFKNNVAATANLVDASLACGIKKFCHISSVAVFNANDKAQVFNENSTWDSDVSHSSYALSKYLAEQEVWRGVAEGLDAVVVNPSVILGEGNWTKSSLKLIPYIWKQPFFYPKGTINLVDVRDIADVVFQLLESSIKNERFILNAKSLSFKDFFEKVAQHLDRKAPQSPLSDGLWKVWKTSASLFRLVSNSPIWQKASINAAVDAAVFENKKIQNSLSFEFRNIDETIAWTCEAFKKSK